MKPLDRDVLGQARRTRTMARDPRRQPEPGDLLTKVTTNGRRTVWRVVKVDIGGITYVVNRKERNCCLTMWWDWANDAEVITEGEAL